MFNKFNIKSFIYLFIVFYSFSYNALKCVVDEIKENEPKKNKTYQIKGKVVDYETKEPLIGANVIILENSQGAATNEKGEFLLKIIGGANEKITLVISLVGYKTEKKKVALKEHTDIEISLKKGLIEMGSVVVTATRTKKLYEESVSKIEVTPRKLIEETSALNLAQALNFQTGVSVDNECSNCNFAQARILGFDGKYSQILLDGDPVFGSLAAVYGLEHIPDDMIEQIEVLKGGGSSLYGGGAIAGSVNILYRKPRENKSAIKYYLGSNDGALDRQLSVITEIVKMNDNLGAFVFGSTRNRNPYDRNKDGFSEIGKLTNQNMGLIFYYKPHEKIRLSGNVSYLKENRRGGSDFEKQPHLARIAEMIEHNVFLGKAKFQHFFAPNIEFSATYSFSLTERDSYYGGLNGETLEDTLAALKYYGFAKNPIHYFGSQLNYIVNNNFITCGVDINIDKMKDKSSANNLYHVEKYFNNAGVYLQDEIMLKEANKMSLILGLRADKNTEIKRIIFSPRIGFKYVLSDIVFRANYSSGFKAPQIFDEDLHIGGLEGIQRLIRNSKNLKEERSHFFSSGLEFQDVIGTSAVMFGITGFYARLLDAYSIRFVERDRNTELWERYNAANATAYGAEADMAFRPNNFFELRSGFIWKKNYFDQVQEDYNVKSFLKTPEIQGYARVRIDLAKNTYANISYKHTGKQLVAKQTLDSNREMQVSVVEAPTFNVFDAAVTHSFFIADGLEFETSLGVRNIFNEYQRDLMRGIERDPNYTYGSSIPRNYYLKARLVF